MNSTIGLISGFNQFSFELIQWYEWLREIGYNRKEAITQAELQTKFHLL